MTPVLFENCFGWFHPAAGTRGVVLCSPYGYEALCTHRGWRMLAETLAEAGHPTLRFDLPGTGDSAGTEDDPDRLATWLDGIDAAIRCLRAYTGVKQVALCGLRFGGTLATLAAARNPAVDALALLAPVVSGRNWLRELRARESVSGAPSRDVAGMVECAGFTLNEQASREIAAIDLRRLACSPAADILLLQQDSRVEAPAAQFAALGARVVRADFAGYDNFVRDAVVSEPPLEDIACVARFVSSLPLVPALAAARVAPQPTQALRLGNGSESPLRFGPDGGLFGILTRPDTLRPHPAVLIVNTGANHHIGNARMSVLLARQLAAQGIATLRMDTQGLGDSTPHPDGPSAVLYTAQSCQDVIHGLDALQAHGHQGAVVVGLCSGAWLALHVALADKRVRGLAAINLQRFIWREGMSLQVALRTHKRSARTYFTALRDRTSWAAAMRGEVDLYGICRMLAQRFGGRLAARLGAALGEGSEWRRVRHWMRALSERHVNVLLVYSDDDPGIDELETYFGTDAAWLRHLPNLALRLVPDADHSLHAYAAREEVSRWLEAFVVSGVSPYGPGLDLSSRTPASAGMKAEHSQSIRFPGLQTQPAPANSNR